MWRTCSRSTCVAAARAMRLPTGYAMEDHARDVLGLLDALELERVVMGGHSFGGLLTYWLAANHPERVERCVVLDAPAGDRPGARRAGPALARPARPCLSVLGRVPRAGRVDAVLRRRRLGRRRRELLPRRRRARCRTGRCRRAPARAHPSRRSRAEPPSTGRRRPPHRAADAAPPAPGSFGPPGSPPLLSREDAERDGGDDGGLHGSSTGSETTSRSCSAREHRS